MNADCGDNEDFCEKFRSISVGQWFTTNNGNVLKSSQHTPDGSHRSWLVLVSDATLGTETYFTKNENYTK